MQNKIHTPGFLNLKVVVFAFLVCFGASVAQGKVQKYRGHIITVDLPSKTMVLDHKKGDQVLKWDDRTEVQGGTFESLAPGQWVRNIMNDPDDGFIRTIRRFPGKDKAE